MSTALDRYELVVGLEVHAQLLTRSKLFSSEPASFGALPNTNISTITLAHPGTLPRLNKKAIELAVRMGIACNCEIEKENSFARKHYFYPDLPKAYQTSQHTTPICKGGYVSIRSISGRKDIPLNRIHIEEDAGKSLHDQDEHYSYIDLNRAGTPLIEIVTEPAIHSAEDAYLFLTELRKLVRWIDVCDGNMEEGSMRCDANISLRKKGAAELGTKVEVKNLNSIRNVKKAIEYETERLASLLDKGERIIQQTRSFDANTDTTFSIRDKEEANDYRYFADPDIPPFFITERYIDEVRNKMPALPQQLYERFQNEFGLSEYDAELLASEKSVAEYFIALSVHTLNYKSAANWINGPIKEYLKNNDLQIDQLPIDARTVSALIQLVDEGSVNFSTAVAKIFPALLNDTSKEPKQLAQEMDLLQTNDTSEIEAWIDQAILNMPDKVEAYKKGKKGLLGLFVAEVKKISKGKADPRIVTTILEDKLRS